MNSHYHDPGDLKQLKRMHELAPVEFEAWLNLDKIVARTDGAIPHKYRELMALAVALPTPCPSCIAAHAPGDRKSSVSGTSAPVRVDTRGRRTMTQNKERNAQALEI